MRQMILLVLVIYAKEYYAQNGFVLDSIDMTDAVFEQCEYCDEKSNQRNQRTEERRNHNEQRNQSGQAVTAQEQIESRELGRPLEEQDEWGAPIKRRSTRQVQQENGHEIAF